MSLIKPHRWIGMALLGLAVGLTGCANNVPSRQDAQTASVVQPPATWQTSLPHGGSTATLASWWAQLGDPLLPELVDAAQQRSATLAAARTRIAQARATLTGAQANVLPGVNASAQATRARSLGTPPATSLSAGVQAAWEIDLLGGNSANRDAAQLRFESAQLGWHEARVSLAAETASTYYSLRQCENALLVTQNDTASRLETARLNKLTANAGLTAPATAALARASAADASSSLRASQAQCSVLVKALVQLSGLEEPVLRQKLLAKKAAASIEYAQAALFSIANVPAQVLLQRPDIATAQRSITAAQLEARAVDARRLPSISLNGSIGGARIYTGGGATSGTTWSLGPLAVTVPLLDYGRNAANTAAAIAAYDEAVVTLRAKVAQAVREVEEALVNLDSVAARRSDVQAAAVGYKESLDATQARYKAGLASLVELEDARRIALQSQQNQLGLERERISAWIALYRAAGGGWNGQPDVPAASLQSAGLVHNTQPAP